PPGGAHGIAALARLLGRAARPLNPANGVEKPREIAVIDEEVCIGCTKCIQACPVDAIVGAAKLMHTVIAQECSGCELCIAPCPVDCILMVPAHDPADDADARALRAAQYRTRYAAHNARLARTASENAAVLAARKAELDSAAAAPEKNAVLAAIARAK